MCGNVTGCDVTWTSEPMTQTKLDLPQKATAHANPLTRFWCGATAALFLLVFVDEFGSDLVKVWQGGFRELGLSTMSATSALEKLWTSIGCLAVVLFCTYAAMALPRSASLCKDRFTLKRWLGHDRVFALSDLETVVFHSQRPNQFFRFDIVHLYFSGSKRPGISMSARWRGVTQLLHLTACARPDCFPEGFPDSQTEWMRRAK